LIFIAGAIVDNGHAAGSGLGWTRNTNKSATQRKQTNGGRTTPYGGVQYESESGS
jgi:hypothetical protein